ncbi:MAG: hypothetical protein AB7D37_10900 [Desulfovibrio sp.]
MDNVLAWEVWSTLDEFDRPLAVGLAVVPRPIQSLAMADFVAAMGGTREDFERVKRIERMMFPAVQKQFEQIRKK